MSDEKNVMLKNKIVGSTRERTVRMRLTSEMSLI